MPLLAVPSCPSPLYGYSVHQCLLFCFPFYDRHWVYLLGRIGLCCLYHLLELVVPQSFVVGVLPHGQHVNQHDQQLPRSILALRTSLWSFGGKGNWQSCVAGCLLHQLAMEQHAQIRKNVKVLGKTC
nr:uncharacterized protein LOC9266156 isoform X1 [Oryza sativa Japonica Group]